MTCPKYANAGCFVSNFSNSVTSGLYRGCSPFHFDDGQPKCNSWSNAEENCKQQCSSSYCNREVVKNLQKCFICTEEFDHAGNKIDSGPGNCVTLNGTEYLTDCQPVHDSCEERFKFKASFESSVINSLQIS